MSLHATHLSKAPAPIQPQLLWDIPHPKHSRIIFLPFPWPLEPAATLPGSLCLCSLIPDWVDQIPWGGPSTVSTDFPSASETCWSSRITFRMASLNPPHTWLSSMLFLESSPTDSQSGGDASGDTGKLEHQDHKESSNLGLKKRAWYCLAQSRKSVGNQIFRMQPKSPWRQEAKLAMHTQIGGGTFITLSWFQVIHSPQWYSDHCYNRNYFTIW